MPRIWTRQALSSCIVVFCTTVVGLSPAHAVVKIFDGFGDADRNNDGVIDFYDTDLNDSGTWNDPTADALLLDRGIMEVTAATDPTDIGVIWSGMRSYDTTANLAKTRARIINDSVATGAETTAQIHNSGLALGVEPRGGGSSLMGRFSQPVSVGPQAGDKLVVSVDFRPWQESGTPMAVPPINSLRWGLYQDTDNELGMTGPFGSGFVSAPPGATVEWGKDDGNWFASQPGAEGDKGIYQQMEFGDPTFLGTVGSPGANARINREWNVAGINGTSPTGSNSNGRILEGGGVSDTPGAGGDVGTVASPPTDGPGAIITDLTYAPKKISMEIIRLADGLLEVATFVNGVEALRDEIKITDTGYNVLGPPPDSFNYVAFRNAADFDYVLDNFKIEVFGSNATQPGDFNGDGKVDAADFVAWRETDGTPAGYNAWRTSFGTGAGSGADVSGSNVPEPASLILLAVGGLLAYGMRRSH